MHILAIDYGTKRIGLAWTDTSLGVVLPYGLVEQPTMVKMATEIGELIKKERINLVLVGFPLGLRGGETKNTERIKKFVFELQKVTDVPVEYADERYSSHGADAMGEGVTRDERAAMFILEGYVQSQKSKKK